MTQREWVQTDYYAELGVPPTASAAEIKKAYRKLARTLHPDANPEDPRAEERFKAVSEAHAVLSDPATRKDYDETRRLFAAGGVPGGGFHPGAGRGGGFPGGFDVGDLFGAGTTYTSTEGGPGGVGDLFEGLFSRGTRPADSRPRRGHDIETETRLNFADAITGVVVPLRLSSPASCTTCHSSGAQPGTGPRTCPTCAGAGVVTRNQGGFGFSEPCADCRATGSLVDHPCPNCHGSGVATRTRTITVRIPPGAQDGQRIRLPGHGEAGLRGAPAGDLSVRVHVNPESVFTRIGPDELAVTVPVSFSELALGTTLSVPTLQGRVGVKVPPGPANGRTFRVPGGGAGDLLVTVTVAVPPTLDAAAVKAIQTYAKAEKASGFDPRAHWAGKR